MVLEVGAVVEGKVTGITDFGVFVALPGGKSGLVHISEVSERFVSDIREYAKNGEMVKVRIVKIAENGRINLSMKQVPKNTESKQQTPLKKEEKAPAADSRSFEERLKKFMQESDSRIADNPLYSDRSRKKRK